MAVERARGADVRVLVQKWEETERGWGQRPDGYSIHLSQDDLDAYVKAYWATQPDAVPDEYERPCGTPYWAEVSIVHDDLLALRSNHGVRRYKHLFPTYPGDGGPDGWRPSK